MFKINYEFMTFDNVGRIKTNKNDLMVIETDVNDVDEIVKNYEIFAWKLIGTDIINKSNKISVMRFVRDCAITNKAQLIRQQAKLDRNYIKLYGYNANSNKHHVTTIGIVMGICGVTMTIIGIMMAISLFSVIAMVCGGMVALSGVGFCVINYMFCMRIKKNIANKKDFSNEQVKKDILSICDNTLKYLI